MKELYNASERSDRIYIDDNGMNIRRIGLDLGLDRRITIGYLSDIHFNYCNEQDFKRADPVVMSTYEHRHWNENAATVPKLRECLKYFSDVDQVVINGDTLDYISCGSMELMEREIWDRLPGVIATVGGHELAMQMEGKVAETTTLEERYRLIERFWRHDIYYYSKLIGGSVIVAGFCNDRGRVAPSALDKLRADIELAREKGYSLLLFAHEPVRTSNPAHESFTVDMLITRGDTGGFPYDFCNGWHLLGDERGDESSRAFYELMVSSADVVKAFFAGHFHNDIYLPILARTSDGSSALIPQYVTTAAAYGNGHITMIELK